MEEKQKNKFIVNEKFLGVKPLAELVKDLVRSESKEKEKTMKEEQITYRQGA